MSKQKRIQEIEKAITRYYDHYSSSRILISSVVVGSVVLVSSFAVYSVFGSGLIAAIVFLVVGFIGINAAFILVVPPAKSLVEPRDLLCGAIREPSRIQSHSMDKVELLDAEGEPHVLEARELKLWKTHVIPFMIEQQAHGHTHSAQTSGRKLTASERRYIEQRRKEVAEIEAKLKSERDSLEKDRSELKIRESDLDQAEEVVIQRLSGVERAEAELEQLKIVAAEQANQSNADHDIELAKKKEAELKAKEAELNAMKDQLARDRQVVDKQKADLANLKNTVTRAPFPNMGEVSGPEQSLAAREAALEARQKELEAEAADLEARASYLTDSENSLIERIDELTHREANIEQSEINAGIRKDT